MFSRLEWNVVLIQLFPGLPEYLWLIQTKKKVDQPLLPFDSWWFMSVVAACLVVVIWGIVRLITRANEHTDPAEVHQQMLLSISELRREGDLSDDEYRSIKSQLMERIADRDSRFVKNNEPAVLAAEKRSIETGPSGMPTGQPTQPAPSDKDESEPPPILPSGERS